MNKIFLLVTLVLLLSVTYVTAQSDLVFKQNQQFDLKVPVFFNGTIASSSANCNITIFDPDGDAIIDNQLMTNQNTFHNFTLSSANTLNIGDHTVSIFCNDQGNDGFSTFNYLISPSGTDDNDIGQLILLSVGFLFSVGFLWFGFNKQDPVFVIFGAFVLFSLGLYMLLNGIAVYRNTLTEGVSIITLGIAGYISVRTGLEMMNG